MNIVSYKRVAEKSDCIQRGLRSTPIPCNNIRKIENRNVSRGDLFFILAKPQWSRMSQIFRCEFGDCSAFCTPGRILNMLPIMENNVNGT